MHVYHPASAHRIYSHFWPVYDIRFREIWSFNIIEPLNIRVERRRKYSIILNFLPWVSEQRLVLFPREMMAKGGIGCEYGKFSLVPGEYHLEGVQSVVRYMILELSKKYVPDVPRRSWSK